jgi:hypothetical protein
MEANELLNLNMFKEHIDRTYSKTPKVYRNIKSKYKVSNLHTALTLDKYFKGECSIKILYTFYLELYLIKVLKAPMHLCDLYIVKDGWLKTIKDRELTNIGIEKYKQLGYIVTIKETFSINDMSTINETFDNIIFKKGE